MEDNNAADIARIRLLSDKKAQEEYNLKLIQATAMIGCIVFVLAVSVEFAVMVVMESYLPTWAIILLPVVSGVLASIWVGKRIKANKDTDKNNPKNF
jgi:uncharacterized protein (DUF983 family)